MYLKFRKFAGGDGSGTDQAAKDAAAKVIADKVIADKALADAEALKNKGGGEDQAAKDAAAKKIADQKVIDDAKAADDAKKAKGDDGKGGDVVPETYDLKLDKESKLQNADVAEIAAFAKENKLTQNQAALLLKGANATAENRFKVIAGEIVKWEGEIAADKTMGATPEETKRVAAIGFKAAFADPDGIITTFLKVSGIGSYPEVVRHFYKYGLTVGEDNHQANGGDKGGKAKTAAQRMYPNQV